MSVQEVNFDGLIGPTHNYAGLSFGNVASTSNRFAVSHPKAAALQGLEKMRSVMNEGIAQAVLPPQRRPDFTFLRRLGFHGSDNQLIQRAWKQNPALVAAAFSASSMWTANAATVSPSSDCADGRLHITPANLTSTLHRAIEAEPTFRLLRNIFADTDRFVVHDPLPGFAALADEGAANHTRMCDSTGASGIELFVYGRDPLNKGSSAPKVFPARQTLQASCAIARNHQLDSERTLFVQQNPIAIDAGAFHNDVVAVGHRNILLYHESAFADSATAIADLQKMYQRAATTDLHCIEIPESRLGLDEAIRTYLFNSQILTRPDGSTFLLCPSDCVESDSDCLESDQAKACLQWIVDGDNPIDSYVSLNLRQSMMNGGGPACLRLRIAMNREELDAMHRGVMLDEALLERLVFWVNRNYRDQLAIDDLRDPTLPEEVASAMRELENILDLPGLHQAVGV